MAYFSKIYLLRQFVSYRGVTYLFGNLRTRARKNKAAEFRGRAENIGILHKRDPLYN